MEKLFDLLKQHCRKRYGFKDNDDLEIDTDSVYFHLYLKGKRLFPIRVETVICKEFGFIKRLVENDKIDIKALIVKGEMRSGWDFDNKKGNEESGEEIWNKYYSELCLMILAIQDEPINFLISILK